MRKYPCIEIYSDKIRHNAMKVVDMCNSKNITVAGVTKVFCGNPEIASILCESGIDLLADSRIENIKKLIDIKCEKMLLRIPMLSEVEDVVNYTDISLNSEVKVVEAISRYCAKIGKKHKIILMIDMGDLREGVMESEILTVAEEIHRLEYIDLVGVGVNLGCFGGVVPDPSVMRLLIEYAELIETKLKIKLEHISAGSTRMLHMVWENTMPERVTHLRIGTAIHLGTEGKYRKLIEGFYDDAYILFAEVVEKKEKPSVPTGQIGEDAFGNIPVFEDRGILKRLILAIGRQDVVFENLTPLDEDVEILGGSSDHMIVNITDSKINYEVGDILAFKMGYSSLLNVFNSDYVHKIIV